MKKILKYVGIGILWLLILLGIAVIVLIVG